MPSENKITTLLTAAVLLLRVIHSDFMTLNHNDPYALCEGVWIVFINAIVLALTIIVLPVRFAAFGVMVQQRPKAIDHRW